MSIEQNAKAQKESAALEYKRNAKREAIRAALGNRPPAYNNYSSQQIGPVHFDLVGEAEKIYQWLIKEVI